MSAGKYKKERKWLHERSAARPRELYTRTGISKPSGTSGWSVGRIQWCHCLPLMSKKLLLSVSGCPFPWLTPTMLSSLPFCTLTCASPTSKLLISQLSPTLVPVGSELPDPLSPRVHTVSDNGLATRVWQRETRAIAGYHSDHDLRASLLGWLTSSLRAEQTTLNIAMCYVVTLFMYTSTRLTDTPPIRP